MATLALADDLVDVLQVHGSGCLLYTSITERGATAYTATTPGAGTSAATQDLLTAGLGKTGLGAAAAPAYANPLSPTALELRRNAIHANYRAILDPSANGGYGRLWGPNIDNNGGDTRGEGLIPGKEYLATLDDGSGRKNVVIAVQIPTSFDAVSYTHLDVYKRQAHEDPARRWVASAAAGVFYIVAGLMAGAVVALIAAFPRELVLAVAGLALLGTIGSGLAAAMKDEGQREAALVTFVVTASGLTLWGVGAAFWGVVAGALVLGVQRLGR